MSRRAVVILVMLGLPLRLSAQDARANRLDGKLDLETQTVVLRTLDSARTRGLPMEPLVDKALEGATKRAAGARIQAAVSSLLGRLEAARDALAPNPTPRDITAGADALAFGATPDALKAMRAIRPNESVAVPLGVLTQLVASGVPVSRATRVVADLLRRGARDEQLIALNDDVRSYVAAGASPEVALDVRTRGLNAVLPSPAAAGVAGDALPGSITTGQKKP
ncbi:MAG TPA: hypothetical protein VJW73_00275 [Gemmatimonadaceae bacterium]|nr:hypothetical protein [Gemmatimonadaceae bacterium]